MIVFDLDGTLADCEHRRHFVDCYNYDQSEKGYSKLRTCDCEYPHAYDPWIHKETGEKWKPDWKSFYKACDKDEPIREVIIVLDQFYNNDEKIFIWSGRCESVRNKTEKWIDKHIGKHKIDLLKMRPIGDATSLYRLKEKWYDLHNLNDPINNIDFAFDSDPESIKMWKRRGIFVFNCCQHEGDF
jgi:hypothetical protein